MPDASLGGRDTHTSRTLRQIHEGCKARHGTQGKHDLCHHCGLRWPCDDYSDAVAALAQLDAAEREEGWGGIHAGKPTSRVLIDDPDPVAGSPEEA